MNNNNKKIMVIAKRQSDSTSSSKKVKSALEGVLEATTTADVEGPPRMLINFCHPVKITRQETFFPSWDSIIFFFLTRRRIRRIKDEEMKIIGKEEIWGLQTTVKNLERNTIKQTRSKYCLMTYRRWYQKKKKDQKKTWKWESEAEEQ